MMGRGKGTKTVEMIETARDILASSHYPLTLRRLYYELISKGVIENGAKSYTSLVTKMTDARWDGDIPASLLDKIVDGGRKARRVWTWNSIEDFAESAAASYETDRWKDQSAYVELWVEKEAVVSILTDVCNKNQIVFRPLHGFNSFTAVHQTAKDLLEVHKNITIFYLGDHDPHGYEIERDAQERLFKMFDLLGNPAKWHQVEFAKRLGILPEDIGQYGIVPLSVSELEKGGDKFAAKRDEFIAAYGDNAAEVDGLPAEVLIERVQAAVDSCIDAPRNWESYDDDLATERAEIRERLEGAA